MARACWSAALVACVFSAFEATASEFFIEFDTLAGHNPGTGATLGSSTLNPVGWRSIGAANGGRFINRCGRTIKAIHLKVNVASHRFRVTSDSGGRLFATVWVKNDGSEAYFLDGNVPNAGAFWMRVPANSQAEIQQCDNQQMCPFNGQVFNENPPAPTGPEWTQVRSTLQGVEGVWRDLIVACPSEWRDVRIYGESSRSDHVLFIADGRLLLFDRRERSVAVLAEEDTILSTVNRITYDRGEFQLFRNGSLVRSIKPNAKGFERVGAATPVPAQTQPGPGN